VTPGELLPHRIHCAGTACPATGGSSAGSLGERRIIASGANSPASHDPQGSGRRSRTPALAASTIIQP